MDQPSNNKPGPRSSLNSSIDATSRLRLALDILHAGEFDLNIPDNTTLRSLQHDRIFGYDTLLPAWTFDMFLDHLLPEDRGFVEKTMQAVFADGSDFSFDSRIRRCDDAVRWIHVAGTIKRDADHRPAHVIGIVQDITDRKNAEEETIARETTFRSLTASAPVGIFITTPNGECTFVNPRWTAISGMTMEQAAGRGWETAIAEEDRQRVNDEWYAAAVEGREFCSTYRFRAPDGRVTWVRGSSAELRDAAGTLRGHVGCILDFTEVKSAENGLRENEHRLATLLDTAPVGIVIHDREGRVKSSNAAARALLGIPDGEMREFPLADPIWQFVHEDGSPMHVDEYPATQVIRTGKDIRNIVGGIRQPGSREMRWVLVNATPVFAPSGELHDAIVTFMDITEPKRADEDRARLNQQIQHSQRLESLGVLAGGIAHDFNNLLTGIMGNASLASMRLDPDSPARPCIAGIETAAQRAAELTKQMLAYSGKGRFVVQAIDLSRVVQEMTTLLHTVITKSARLQFDFASGASTIEADVTQIRQVVMNLITNASEALGDKEGVISIRTGVRRATREYLHSSYLPDEIPAGEYTFLEVSDNGCGMDEATRARIFDPFFSTKFVGRGLGLAAVLGIVRGHKGAIRVSSEFGRGTTITVLFPCSAKPEALEEPTGAIQRAEKSEGLILLVDDEDTVRSVARMVLEETGYRVLEADNGREGVDLVQANLAELRAVFLDLTMPVMGGDDALQEIKRLRPDLPVILMSGYSEQELMEQFEGKGLAGFLQKPFRMADLLRVLRRALA